MKIAARFPVTDYTFYFVMLLLLHVTILVFGLLTIGYETDDWLWQVSLLVFLVLLSLTFSYQHYLAITRAEDDLCWTGELWVMNFNQPLNSPHYLKLQPGSWISQRACLLHFIDGEQQYYWLFSRASLGVSLYSQLVRLAKADIDQLSKRTEI
jgi:hypothetical protein